VLQLDVKIANLANNIDKTHLSKCTFIGERQIQYIPKLRLQIPCLKFRVLKHCLRLFLHCLKYCLRLFL